MIKREKGKHNSDVTVDDFYKYYASKVHNPVSRKVFGDFYRDMFKEFSQLMLNGKEVKLNNIGGFKVIEYKPKLLKNGELNKRVLVPNWVKTKEYWAELYPDKSPEELKLIKEKPLVYYENNHTRGQQYKFYWDRINIDLRCKSAYQFKAIRSSNRELSKILKSEDRKIYYYRK
jgi:nucleoid DNA-binding protein|tara:strand:+ start:6752 stop:7273 length:522 start_codon:yes stop_codon:yes gene_type:complete